MVRNSLTDMVLDVIQAQHGSPVVVAAPLVLLLRAVAQLVLDHLEQTAPRVSSEYEDVSQQPIGPGCSPTCSACLTWPCFRCVCSYTTHGSQQCHTPTRTTALVRMTWISHFYKYEASDLLCEWRWRGRRPTHTHAHAHMIKPMPTHTHACTH